MPVHVRVATDPIHPLVVEFPIVLHAATVAALIGHAIDGDRSWYRAALYASAASIAMAIVAVVPSITDLFGLSATAAWRRLARYHAACNVAALVATSAAFATICSNYAGVHELGDAAPLALAGVGLAAAIAAGWLGWTMAAMLGGRARIDDELVARLPRPRR